MKIGSWMIAGGMLFLSALAAQAQTASQPCVSPQEEKRGAMERVMSRGPSTTVDVGPGENVCPLTAREKLGVWARRSYSPVNLLVAGVDAAVWQASQDKNHGYGQGWEAYGSRYGASLANSESSAFFQSFLLASLLHEDPRYFREGRGGGGHRIGYAISRVFVTRTDRGSQRFNFSGVGGALMSAGLSNAYYPDDDRNVARTMEAAGLNLAATAGWNILREFGPDLVRKFRHK